MLKRMKKMVAILCVGTMVAGMCSIPAKQVQATTEPKFDYSFKLGQASGNDSVSTTFDSKFELYNYQFAGNREGLPTTTAMATPTKGPLLPSGTGDIVDKTQNVLIQGGANPAKFLHLATGNGYANALTTMVYKEKTFENFYAEYEFFPSTQLMGLVIGGEKNQFPVTKDGDTINDTGVVVCMRDGGRLRISGAIDTSSAVLPDGKASQTDNDFRSTNYIGVESIANRSLGLCTSSITTNDDATIATMAYTVCVQVQDGVLTVWESQTPDVKVSVELAGQYQAGYVSLFSNVQNNGAFRSFKIKELEATYAVNQPLNANTLASLKDNFEAYQFDTTAGTCSYAEDPDEFWNADGENQFGNFQKKGLLISNCRASAKKVTTLTLKDTIVRNFEAGFTYYLNFTAYGIMIAPAEQMADANFGLNLQVMLTSDGTIHLAGAYDPNSVVKVGYTDTLPGFVVLENDKDLTKINTSYTVRVRIENGTVKVWVEEIPDCYLTAKLTAGYQGGKLSLYSTGCDQGGFKRFFVQEYLNAPEPENETVTLRKENINDYTVVSIYANSEAGKMYNSILNYDQAKYTYMGTRLIDTVSAFSSPVGIDDANGKITLSMLSGKAGKQAVVVFKNDQSVKETTPFSMNGTLSGVGGVTMNTAYQSSLYADINGDGTVDVRDLVRLYKKAKGENVTVNELNSDLDDTGNITGADNLSCMKKSLVGVGSTRVGNLVGKTGLFLGDSIAYGAGDYVKGTSWGGRLQTSYGMTSEVVAVSGRTLSSKGEGVCGVIVNEFDKATREAYDYVILHGGVNDVWRTTGNNGFTVDIGTLAEVGATEFDTTTLIGALEHLIYTAKTKYPNAKLGYIINFDISTKIGDMTAYVTAAKAVCEKWNVPYVDLYNNAYLKNLPFDSSNTAYIPDGVHPNARGYEILTPIIAEWMETL